MTMDDLTTYLRSSAALDDVRALLGPKVCQTAMLEWDPCDGGKWLSIKPRNGAGPAVYYNPGNGIVSDMGSGVLALRLRTGDLTHPADLSRSQDPERWQRVVEALDALPDDGGWQGDALVVFNVGPEALPQTICAVLLAAYLLGRL